MTYSHTVPRRSFDGWLRTLTAPVLNCMPEIDEDGPQHDEAEDDGDDATGKRGVEAPSGVGAVTFAEAVLERGSGAAVAGAAEMQALSRASGGFR